jgi:hypothetical protein
MANRFGGGGHSLKLSNAATDVFLSVLQFALSDLAATRWQRELAQWIAWHDQNLTGVGTVGFDLEHIVWPAANFADQKAFLLSAIDLAGRRYRWDELCYDPPSAHAYLHEYRDVVVPFERPAAPTTPTNWGWPGPEDAHRFCPVHAVHCSDLGRCRVCMDCAAGSPTW